MVDWSIVGGVVDEEEEVEEVMGMGLVEYIEREMIHILHSILQRIIYIMQ